MKLKSRILNIVSKVCDDAHHGKCVHKKATDQLLKLFKEYKRELIKIIDEYKCDFNWDFEKGKSKKKNKW